MIVIAILLAFLVSTPWITLGIVGLLYAGSIPLSYLAYKRIEQRQEDIAENGAEEKSSRDEPKGAKKEKTGSAEVENASEGGAEIAHLHRGIKPPRDEANG